MAKKNKNKKHMTQAEIEYQNRMESFQEHLPIADIRKRLLVTKEGLYYPMFKMGDKTLDLMSEEELNNFANRVMQVFASMNLEGVQFLTVPVPFDIGPYKANQEKQIKKIKKDIDKYNSQIVQLKRVVEEKRAYLSSENEYIKYDDSNEVKKNIQIIENVEIPNLLVKIKQCELFIQYITTQTSYITDILNSGLAAHKVCIVIPCIKDNDNDTAVNEACLNIESKLKGLAQDSHRCSEQEMRDVLYALLNPMRKDNYSVPASTLPPILS